MYFLINAIYEVIYTISMLNIFSKKDFTQKIAEYLKNIYSCPERWIVTSVGKTKFYHLSSKNCRYIQRFADSSKKRFFSVLSERNIYEYVTHLFRRDQMSVTGWRGQAPLQ